MTVNSATVIGEVWDLPEITDENGMRVARFQIGLDEKRKCDGGEWHDHLVSVPVIVQGKQAEACERLDLGTRIAVTGRLSSYEPDEFAGRLGVNAHSVEVLSTAPEAVAA